MGSTLADTVRQRRVELGLTQQEVADRFDPPISQSAVSAIERGTIKQPPWTRVQQLAAALELNAGELLELSGWTGASDRPAFNAPPVAGPDANSRWRLELIARIHQLNGKQVRAVLAVVIALTELQ